MCLKGDLLIHVRLYITNKNITNECFTRHTNNLHMLHITCSTFTSLYFMI